MRGGRHVSYREVTPWPLWVTVLVLISCIGGVVGVLAGAHKTLSESGGVGSGGETGGLLMLFIVGGSVVLLTLAFLVLWNALVVEVTPDELTVTFGKVRWPTKRIAFGDVKEMAAITYHPIREFGGWGIRFSGGGRSAWTTRGNKALKVELKSGKTIYVGSDHPERLLARISAAAGTRYEWTR